MVVFGATTTFFMFFLDAQCFSKEYVAGDKAVKDYQALVGKKKIFFCTFCSSLHEEDSLSSTVLSEEECEEFSEKYQNLCYKPRSPTLYTGAWLPSNICTDLSATLYSGFMDVISRLPPPGGTTALDIFRTVLITSYHLSSRFMKEFQTVSSSSLRVDIVFDADYEAVLGERVVEFQNFLLWHLNCIFRRSQYDIHTLTIKKGSIGITFFINLVNCIHCKKLGNRCIFSDMNHFHEELRQNYISETQEIKSDETEFLSFLRYMKYHLSFKHYNLLQRVPFSVKTSTLVNSKLRTEKSDLFDAKDKKGNIFKSKDYFLPTITSISQYNKEMHQTVPSKVDRANLERKSDGKENFHQKHVGLENLHHNRIRRYIAREDDSSMKLKVQFKLEKPAKNGNEEKFQRHIVSQLAKAMRVPVPSIKDMKITSETDVSFTLSAFNDQNNVMDDISVIEAADSLKAKIRSQQLRLRDMNGQIIMTAGSAYASVDEPTSDYSVVILVILCITLVILTILIIITIYIARRQSRIPRNSTKRRNEAYRNFQNLGRDSSQSVGKYSYDSGLWLGPGPEPNFTVPEAPYYRPPTVEQIASTPRPVTSVRTRLKKNWNVDERALSTIPDDFRRNYVAQDGHSRR